MELTGIVYPERLWVLSEVLLRHCEALDIKRGTTVYDREEARIIALYENGARTIYQLLAGLNAEQNALNDPQVTERSCQTT